MKVGGKESKRGRGSKEEERKKNKLGGRKNRK